VEAQGGLIDLVDLPMHGANTQVQPDSIEGYAEWVSGYLTSIGETDIVLAGHSMGGLIALEVAGRNHPAIGRLVVMAIGHPLSVSEELLSASATDVEAACFFIGKWSSTPETKEAIPQVLASHTALSLSLADGVVTKDLHACNNYTGAIDAASAITVPTVVVIPSRDKMVPPHTAEPIIGALADVETISIEGAGHAVEHECPDLIVSTLLHAAAR
jgi:pimeloyl-ACP methyl ester carboxylesterase